MEIIILYLIVTYLIGIGSFGTDISRVGKMDMGDIFCLLCAPIIIPLAIGILISKKL